MCNWLTCVCHTAELITTKAIKETRSFTITAAIDPETGDTVDVGYALERGIIDQANGQYIGQDPFGREMCLPVSEAIKKGYIIADATSVKRDVKETGPKFIQETQKLTVKAVVDPGNNKQITVSDAIKKGILNQSQGQYVNPLTG